MKILVVEDDAAMATTVSDLFSMAYHYAVDVAVDGKTGLEMAEMLNYDLVILDVLLPDLDGVTVCQHLREKGLTMPILLLTGEDGSEKIAKAINLGADDYVVKPFNADELGARVQALLRRGGANTLPILEWGNLCLNPNHRKVTYNDHLLNLLPKEYGILELFLRNGEQVFSPKVILDQVWSSDRFPGEEVIRVHIRRLRAKLKVVGAPPDFIQTVYRVGYRLNLLYKGRHLNQTQDVTQANPPHQANSSEPSKDLTEPSPTKDSELIHLVSDQKKTLPDSQTVDPMMEIPSSQDSDSSNTLVHDLNNVFGAILASVQFLQFANPELDEMTKEQLNLIEQYSKDGASRVKRFFSEQEEIRGE